MTIRSFNSLVATEKSLAVYLVLTAILILVGLQSIPTIIVPIIIRIALLGGLYLLSKFQKANNKPGIVRTLWPLLTLTYLYGETDVLNNILFKNNLDSLIACWEFAIFKSQPALQFSRTLPSNIFAEFMYLGYFAYYLLIVGIPYLIYKEKGVDKALYAVFLIMNSFFIYYLIFILFPVAGPQFYYKDSLNELPRGYLFGWLIRLIQHMGEAPTAAFPSSHVSICLMLVWLSYKFLKKWFLLVVPVSLLLILSTVYIKAHYTIDVLAAFITTPIIYYTSKTIYKKMTFINAFS